MARFRSRISAAVRLGTAALLLGGGCSFSDGTDGANGAEPPASVPTDQDEVHEPGVLGEVPANLPQALRRPRVDAAMPVTVTDAATPAPSPDLSSSPAPDLAQPAPSPDLAQPAPPPDLAQPPPQPDMAQPLPTGCTGPGNGAHVCGTVYRMIGGNRTPVPGAQISIWVQQGGSGHHVTVATTDASGYFDLANVANGFYVFYAHKDGHSQPCGQSETVSGASRRHDIEIVSNADLQAGAQPAASPSYTVSGTARKQGVAQAGIGVQIQWIPDLVTATTVSGPGGAYKLCGAWAANSWGLMSYALGPTPTTIYSDVALSIDGNEQRDVGN